MMNGGLTPMNPVDAPTSRVAWWHVWKWPLLLWELLWMPKPQPIGMTVD